MYVNGRHASASSEMGRREDLRRALVRGFRAEPACVLEANHGPLGANGAVEQADSVPCGRRQTADVLRQRGKGPPIGLDRDELPERLVTARQVGPERVAVESSTVDEHLVVDEFEHVVQKVGLGARWTLERPGARRCATRCAEDTHVGRRRRSREPPLRGRRRPARAPREAGPASRREGRSQGSASRSATAARSTCTRETPVARAFR